MPDAEIAVELQFTATATIVPHMILAASGSVDGSSTATIEEN